jgi:hypothetical protein
MTTLKLDPISIRIARWKQWLSRPLSNFWCVISWLGATAVFFGLSGVLGGPTESDAAESVYATWSFSHGNLACTYPPSPLHHLNDLANPFALAAPLYPLLSGVGAFLLRIGHAIRFPSQHQLGPQCASAFVSIFNWSAKSGAILPTVRLGYLVWPILMAGVIALLRASGRGRRGWEPLTLLLLACTPPVLTCLTFFFHPQDLLAVGLIFGGVACFLKERWFWAGALFGLAVCSQQFALLVGVALLFVAPTKSRIRFVAGAIMTAVLVDGPLIVATSGRATKIILTGSSRVGANVQSVGGTVLWEMDLHGLLLFTLSRVAPIVAAMALAWWASRRLGPRILSPVPLISLVATSLTLRLAFEENLFGYYFMAAAVALLVLNVARGRMTSGYLAWLALVTLVFNPVHLNFVSNLTSRTVPLYNAIPILILVVAIAWAAYDVVFRRIPWFKLMWILAVMLTCESKLWGLNHSIIAVPSWLWQVVLVSTALEMALRPLFTTIKSLDSPIDHLTPKIVE